MSVTPVGESAPNTTSHQVGEEFDDGSVYDGDYPALTLVSDESYTCARSDEGLESRGLYNKYVQLREEAALEPKVDGKELVAIQEQSRAWIAETGILDLPESQEERVSHYGSYDQDKVRAKFVAFTDYLELYHGGIISDTELDATRAFIDSTFAMYTDDTAHESGIISDADGTFAFIVPARMSRATSEYGQEVEPVIPALRYLPNELRAEMMVGLPPFIIDTYQVDENKRRGYLVLAPVFGDMATDLESQSDKVGIARENVNNAVDFVSRRLGVEVVGLGATLPSLTKYGQTITNEKVITTTGHGGTVELIALTMEAGLDGEVPESIGILGLGAIGASVAEILADRNPGTLMNVFDTNVSRARRLAAAHEGRFTISESGAMLVEDSALIVSAITGHFSLQEQGVKDVKGKKFYDDSQPAALDPAEFEAAGGTVQWIIGSDSQRSVATRTGYDFASMLDGQTDIFGCEAEVGVIAKYMAELRIRGMGEIVMRRIAEKVAIKDAVTPQAVRYISALFKKYGVVASQPQAFGRPVELH